MIFTLDRGWAARLIAALTLAFALAAGPAAPGRAGPGLADNLVHDAHVALARGDGIAAEMGLRKAMAAGLSRDAAAARMGEAYLDQGNPAKAREWLGPARFAPAEAAHGWRMLGRLEMADRNLPAAGAAFDRALRLSPHESRQDSQLWLDIARLRYLGGEQLQAAQAADRALQLDPANVRALEYRGMLVRDRYGLNAALPWFEAGLKLRPDDLPLLGEYAATLGELGRARQMLTITRRMIALDADSPRAFFLQAVLAARAGNVPLARGLINRSGAAIARMPAGMLLLGALELQAGNANTAAALLDALNRQQPGNAAARMLLARALYAADRRQLLDRFAVDARRRDASAYLLALLGRTYEDMGRRDLAAPLLDRAASAGASPWSVAEEQSLGTVGPALSRARHLLAAGRTLDASAVAEQAARLAPGSAEAQVLAGDVRLIGGDFSGALTSYRMAGTVRLTDGLMLRLVAASAQAGQGGEAERLVSAVLSASPRNRTALRLAANAAGQRGNWARAAQLLGYLAATGSQADARLQADLALARLRAGDPAGSRLAANRAYRLQRSSPLSAQALGMVLAEAKVEMPRARALLAKAAAAGVREPH